MTDNKILIVYREDPELNIDKLNELDSKKRNKNKIEDFSFSFSANAKDLYSNISQIAKGKGAKILVINKETKNLLEMTLYKDSKINLSFPEELFESTIGVNAANQNYYLTKSIKYILSKGK